tara:strand:- start:114 stop:494 length:381 start_codon:yes stop_codon:yes gene_type:complete
MNFDKNTKIFQLQKSYINKYYTTKYVNDVINVIEYDYLNWLNEHGYDEYIINPQIDMIIFLLTKEQFQRIVRSALILMNFDKDEKNIAIQICHSKQNSNKFDTINKLKNMFPSFLSYFVISLYLYI